MIPQVRYEPTDYEFGAVFSPMPDRKPSTADPAPAPAAPEARALYREDQARDEGGKFTDEGGGSSRSDTARSEGEADVLQRWPKAERVGVVTRRAKEMAASMGVDPEIIHVVDKEPREFTVGELKFREAGHYSHATRQIELNVQGAYSERMSVTQGLTAHEVSHAIYHDVLDVIEREHGDIRALPTEENDRLFRKNGYPRPEAVDEIKQRWPASAALADTWGDAYLTEDPSVREKMTTENGHSAYAKAYWQPDALAKPGGIQLAVNETLAEVNRYLEAPLSWAESDTPPKPRSPWMKMAKAMRKIHGKHVAKKKATA